MLAARHGQRASHVLLLVELGLDRVARATGPVALGIAALHDEIGHDSMEGQAVVEALLRQRDEVLDRLGRVFGVEVDADLVCRLLLEKKNLRHFWTTLMDLNRTPTFLYYT